MRLWSVEGNRQRLDGGAMFGNVPRNLWAQWLVPDAENRLEFACRCLLVEDLDGATVLFETGIGAFFEPKLRARYGVLESEHVLLRSLAARGVRARGRRRRRAEPSAFRSRRRLAQRVRRVAPAGALVPARALHRQQGARGRARARRIRAIARRTSRSCRSCCAAAAGSRSSTARSRRCSARPCASTSATATRRASRSRRSAARAASRSART